MPQTPVFPLPVEVDATEFSDWALSPSALQWLCHFIHVHPVRSIVELGSGLSTILLAALQRDGYLERWVSLEHDPDWHLYVLQRLRQKSLSLHAQVMLCPLVQSRLEECRGQWYDTRMIAPFPAQLVLIDGPPGHSAPLARYPAPYQLKSWMTPGTWLILDDADRPPEQETIRRWLDEIPSLAWIATIPTNTGLAVLRFMESHSDT